MSNSDVSASRQKEKTKHRSNNIENYMFGWVGFFLLLFELMQFTRTNFKRKKRTNSIFLSSPYKKRPLPSLPTMCVKVTTCSLLDRFVTSVERGTAACERCFLPLPHNGIFAALESIHTLRKRKKGAGVLMFTVAYWGRVAMTIITWASEGFFPGRANSGFSRGGQKRFLQGRGKSGKNYFNLSKLRKQPVFANNLMRKCQISKSKEWPCSPASTFRRPWVT